MTNMPGETSDPREFFRLLWRRKWILVACVVLIPVAAYVISTRLPKTYQASTVVQLQSPAAASQPGVGDVLGVGGNEQQANDRVAALIETNGVADQAARLLEEPEGSLRGDAQATADEDTGFITIVAEASSSARAAEVANTFSDAVRATRRAQGEQRVDNAIASTQEQLDALDEGDEIERDQLTAQLQGLRALRNVQGQNVQVIEPATPPASAASPKPLRNAIFALILALIIGAGLIALVDRLDRRIHDPEDLERLTGSPLLVRIPPEAFGKKPLDESHDVAFQMLRDSLMFFNVEKRLDSLIVVSSLKGEGKTTVAANLAMAYARSGKRTVLIDADLRSPELGPRIGVDRSPGLSHVLAGEHELDDVIREVEPFGGRLRVVPGGAPPPNPSELLTSTRMTALFERLKGESDIVIVDTPPLLLVSDAFSLLEQAAGAVGVARLEQTPKDAVAKMARIVATVHTRLLGVVATGGTPPAAGGGGYGYGYGYGEKGSAPAAPPPSETVPAADNGHDPNADVPGPVERPGRSS